MDLPLDDPRIAVLLDQLRAEPSRAPLLLRLGHLRRTAQPDDRPIASTLLAWAAAFPDAVALSTAIDDTRARLAALRRDDATMTLATAHATKGAEFDHVAVVGLDVGRFPSGRSVAEADDPARALEEERRLAYVAWTRARRTLILSYDPAAPSPFLLEAFDPAELAPGPTIRFGPD
jgi:hypothetical protein